MFQHHDDVWRAFPTLAAGALLVTSPPDPDRVAGLVERHIEVATGEEVYLTFGGEREHPAPGEITFADTGGNAHARRWTNRQSGLSAVTAGTTTALIVTEALHDTAATDVVRVTAALAEALGANRVSVLTRNAPRFTI